MASFEASVCAASGVFPSSLSWCVSKRAVKEVDRVSITHVFEVEESEGSYVGRETISGVVNGGGTFSAASV